VTLADLVRDLPGTAVAGPGDAAVLSLAIDSRAVTPGALFAALPGARVDGARFVGEAVARGAVGILARGPRPADLVDRVAWVSAPAPRAALAAIARRFFGAPDERLAVVGVTGTNGKTSTTWFLAGALERGGVRTAVGGTLGQFIGARTADTAGAALTTPEAPQIFGFLAAAERAGAGAAALEVSSAALISDRVGGLRFAAGVLTSIGHDHLDLHGTHDAYRAAKRRLFEGLDARAVAVLPLDDPFHDEFAAASRAGRTVTFGDSPAAEWRVSAHRPSAEGARFHLAGPGFDGEVTTGRPGQWDARNIAAAVAAAVALGTDPVVAVDGAAAVSSVPGRYERLELGQPFAAIVDYAHTPQALERLLSLARRVTPGRVIVVFGCGGERDRAKRGEMGRIAGRLADVVLVTDDNPRGEDPEAIAAAIVEGLAGAPILVERIPDRHEAIERAVRLARPGDCVIVAGKGHESVQEIAGRRIPCDDRVALRAAIAAARVRP